MKKITVLILALLLFVLFLMYQQEITNFFIHAVGKEAKKAPAKAIASITDNRKNVTIKRSNETVWDTAKSKERLALMDAVSTGYDSNALVAFDIGYIINVGERSLLVIDNPKQEIANLLELNFDRGTIQVSNTVSNDTTLKIRSDSVTTELKGQSDFTLSVDKDTKKAEIWIKIGEAKVSDKNGNQIIVKANERKKFSTDKAIQIDTEPPVVVPTPEPTPEIKPEVKKVEVQQPKKPKKVFKRLRRNDVERYVKAQKSKISTCYENKKATAEGRSITVRLIIQSTGIVSRASIVDTTLKDPLIERCVLFWMRGIKFPKFEGPPADETVGFLFQ